MKSSTFASASKKRKISRDDHDHDDVDEEENMEKFYALIKSIREARDRLIVNNGSSSAEIVNKAVAAADDDQSETKKRKLEEDQTQKQVLVWSPSFRREDFVEGADYKMKKLPAVNFDSTYQSKHGGDIDDYGKKKEVKEELDLSLSL